MSGYKPLAIALVNIIFRGKTTDWSLMINILELIPSGPLALPGFNPRIIWRMASLLIKMDSNLFSVRSEKVGKTLVLQIGLH